MDVAEYSEYGFKCNFWDVRQWVTQSVIGIPRVAMISRILFAPWNVLCVKSLFSLLVCLALNFTDIILYRDGPPWSFMIKVMMYECHENEPYPLILKEQIDHLWSTYII